MPERFAYRIEVFWDPEADEHFARVCLLDLQPIHTTKLGDEHVVALEAVAIAERLHLPPGHIDEPPERERYEAECRRIVDSRVKAWERARDAAAFFGGWAS